MPPGTKYKKYIKRIGWTILILFILMNVVACFHAYKFTHFDTSATAKTKDARHLSIGDKIGILLTGINNPRPENKITPDVPFKTIVLKSNKNIECWLIKAPASKGTVIIFHGYSGEKSTMLDKAQVFRDLGYNVLLVDFMGSGGSEGNQTTIGFYEAQEVKTAYSYVRDAGEKNIVLFGTSMGAAAIMKCINDDKIGVNAIIVECPFGSMLKTVQARFNTMHVPTFPMANLLVFWGGIQNNFNAFGHNPANYAKNITCPTLLFYGQKDEKVSQQETNDIYNNLKGPKQLVQFPLAGHDNYLRMYKEEWIADVTAFLSAHVH